MAICISKAYRSTSVPCGRVDDVEERLASRESPEVVAEELDAPIQDPAARP
jgi:hypothetical protein